MLSTARAEVIPGSAGGYTITHSIRHKGSLTTILVTLARVYEYGLLPPTLNHELVLEQMRSAHRYRNTLVEIERERREAVAKALASHVDVEPIAAEVAVLVAERETTFGELKRTNANARSKVDQPERKAKLRDIATKLREVRGRMKEAKLAIKGDAGVTAAITAADDRAKQRVRDERAKCSTYWCTYLLQEAAVDQARKAPTPPRFTRFEGEGRVSVQLQGGIDISEIWGGDSQVEIKPVDPRTFQDGTTRGDRRRLSRTTLRIRVQSDEKGRPVWAEFPMILHRPLPAGCRIKVATVHRRRRDCRMWDWRLTVQVELADTWTRGKCGEGTVALNLGFAANYEHLRGALRAGYLVDDRGSEREIVLQRSVIDRVEKSESLRSIRDKNLDAMRVELVDWMRANEATLPQWIVDRTIMSRPPRPGAKLHAIDGAGPILVPGHVEQTAEVAVHLPERGLLAASEPEAAPSLSNQGPLVAGTDPEQRRRLWHIVHWRSAERFRALAFAWRAARWDGDEAGYDIIEKWRYRDEHLQRYEAGMLRGALLDRRETYRVIAAQLANTYRTLVVHDTDLSEIQRLPSPTSDEPKIPVARRNQRHAAGSILRGCLENAFKRQGGKVVVVDDHQITATCHACGSLERFDQATEREHTCGECGVTWDQDFNACKNMLKRERSAASAEPVAPTEKKESRSERLRRSRTKAAPEVEIARDA